MYASTQTKGLDKAEWTVIEIVAWHSATFITSWHLLIRIRISIFGGFFCKQFSYHQHAVGSYFNTSVHVLKDTNWCHKLRWIKIATTQALNLRLKVQPTQHSFFSLNILLDYQVRFISKERTYHSRPVKASSSLIFFGNINFEFIHEKDNDN